MKSIVLAALLSALAAGLPAQQVSVGMAGQGFSGPKLGFSVLSTGPRGLELLKRADVQATLRLSIRQKSDLDELLSSPNGARVSITSQGSTAPSADDLKRQVEEQIKAQGEGRTARIKAILNETQYARLMELDLQWRGPRALQDVAIAEAVRIRPGIKQGIAEAVGEYDRTKQQVMMELSQTEESGSDDGSSRMVKVKINTEELEKPFSPHRQKLEKARKKMETAILALLDGDESRRWAEAQGTPFAFRKDIKGLRF